METKRSDYSLLLNELHSKAEEQRGEMWRPETEELPAATHGRRPILVPLQILEGSLTYPHQLQVGNLWLGFDKDGTLVSLHILDNSAIFSQYKAEPPKQKLA